MEVNITPAQGNNARKRVRNEYNWKRNVQKRNRYSAKKLPDLNNLGKCRHKTEDYKCNDINHQDVRKFHQSFYSKPEKIYQDNFILKFIRIQYPLERKRKKGTRAPSETYTNFYIRTYVKPYRMKKICQRVFLQILGIGIHRVRNIAKKFLTAGQLPIESRGGDRISHKNTHKAQAVMQFIESFKCVESHYCRSSTSTRKYVSSELNIKKMWKMYQVKHSDEFKVRQCFFRNIFVKKYNIGFKTPRVDVCSKCLEFSVKIKSQQNPALKQMLITEQRIHKLKANSFYYYLKQKEDKTLTMSFDCQKNQVLPKIPDQSAYYSRQLYNYNFTIVVGTSTQNFLKENVHIYTWTENTHCKSSNEIASAVFDLLKKIDLAVPGHSFMPADRIFGLIEKEIKSKEQVILPREYISIYENYGQITKLGVECEVKNWKEYCSNIMKPTNQYHFKFAECKRFYITRVKNREGRFLLRGEVNYKTDLGVAKSVMKRNTTTSSVGVRVVEPFNVSVSKLKLDDVDSLLVKHYGCHWKTEFASELSFYKNAIENVPTFDGELTNDEPCEFLPEQGVSI
ncbi:hypothetical protein evm_014607 [Chilo suppressalis]|nr:hypothetical protein evm_014607 [Chilo suppressalis]